MRTPTRLLAAAVLTAFAAVPAHAEVDEAELQRLAADARAVSDTVMNNLKGVLMEELKANGPLGAVEVCNVKAPKMAAKASETFGWQVARTSARNRNPDNAPDAFEAEVLADFEARKAAGEPLAEMEHIEAVQEDGQTVVRYMRPIDTKELCVTCHGTDIEDDLSARLYELYPDDKARGFQVGDIRGAFTFRKVMD